MQPLPSSYKKDAIDKLKDDEIKSFRDKNSIKEVLLEEGDTICRFVSGRLANIFSNYWVSNDTMKELMTIFQRYDADEFRNQGFKQNAKNNIKERLAILNYWDLDKPVRRRGLDADPARLLNYRVRIKLKKPVVGYIGSTGIQKNHLIDELETEIRGTLVERRIEQTIGGSEQIVIPRFWRITSDEGFEYADKDYFVSLFKERLNF